MPLLLLDDGETAGTAGPPEQQTRLVALAGETRLRPLLPAQLAPLPWTTRLTPLGLDTRLREVTPW